MGTRAVMVMVTNVDEIGTLSGPETVSYMEKGTGAVGTYTVSGGSMSAMANLTLMGDDAGDFMIMDDGMLKFSSPPQLRDAPMDMDMDNMYMVTVKAEAGGEMDMMDVTVTVANEEEMGEVTLWAGNVALTMAPQVGDTITGLVVDDGRRHNRRVLAVVQDQDPGHDGQLDGHRRRNRRRVHGDGRRRGLPPAGDGDVHRRDGHGTWTWRTRCRP